MCKFPVFEILKAKCWWSRSRTVQGQRRSKNMVSIDSARAVYRIPLIPSSHLSPFSKYLISNFNDLEPRGIKVIRGQKFIVPIENPCLISYLMSFESNIITLVIFEIFEVKFLWTRSRVVQDQPRSTIMVPIDSAWVVSYSTSIDRVIIYVTVFEIFDVKF